MEKETDHTKTNQPPKNTPIFVDPSILNGGHTSTYDRDRKNLSNAAHVSNALKNEDHRRTLEQNIQKSLHNTLQLNNLQLQETLNNSISNHNSQSASSENKSEFQDSLAKVQIKSTLGVRNQDKTGNNTGKAGGTGNSNSNNSNKSRHTEAKLQQNLNTERIPQITSSVQQIKPQFSPHLPTAGGHNAMNIGSGMN